METFKQQRKDSFENIKNTVKTQRVSFGSVTGTRIVVRAIDDGSASAAGAEWVIAGPPGVGEGHGCAPTAR